MIPLSEIYVDDVLITDVMTLPEHKVQAYQVARGITLVLSNNYHEPLYVRVQVPGDEHPDLWVNYQYRFNVRIGNIIGETYASGQLVEDSAETTNVSNHLALMIQREFKRLDRTPA